MGTGLVTLCTGTRDPEDQWRWHPDNAAPEAWADLLAEMEKALAIAERHDVALGIEPELANVVSDAAAARRLLDDLREPAAPHRARPREPLRAGRRPPSAAAWSRRPSTSSAADLAMAHAKDRTADGSFTAAGKGVIDFGHFIGCLRARGLRRPARHPRPLRRRGARRRALPRAASSRDPFLRDGVALALRGRGPRAARPLPARPRRRRRAGRRGLPRRPAGAADHPRMPRPGRLGPRAGRAALDRHLRRRPRRPGRRARPRRGHGRRHLHGRGDRAPPRRPPAANGSAPSSSPARPGSPPPPRTTCAPTRSWASSSPRLPAERGPPPLRGQRRPPPTSPAPRPTTSRASAASSAAPPPSAACSRPSPPTVPASAEDEIRRIAVPTLVIGHGRDLAHPLAHAEALAALIPGARLRRHHPQGRGPRRLRRATSAPPSPPSWKRWRDRRARRRRDRGNLDQDRLRRRRRAARLRPHLARPRASAPPIPPAALAALVRSAAARRGLAPPASSPPCPGFIDRDGDTVLHDREHPRARRPAASPPASPPRSASPSRLERDVVLQLLGESRRRRGGGRARGARRLLRHRHRRRLPRRAAASSAAAAGRSSSATCRSSPPAAAPRDRGPRPPAPASPRIAAAHRVPVADALPRARPGLAAALDDVLWHQALAVAAAAALFSPRIILLGGGVPDMAGFPARHPRPRASSPASPTPTGARPPELRWTRLGWKAAIHGAIALARGHEPCLIGLDFGSESARGVLLDAATGAELGPRRPPLRPRHPHHRAPRRHPAAAGLRPAGRRRLPRRRRGDPRHARPRPRDRRHRRRLHRLLAAPGPRRRHATLGAPPRPPARLRQALEARRRAALGRGDQREGRRLPRRLRRQALRRMAPRPRPPSSPPRPPTSGPKPPASSRPATGSSGSSPAARPAASTSPPSRRSTSPPPATPTPSPASPPASRTPSLPAPPPARSPPTGAAAPASPAPPGWRSRSSTRTSSCPPSAPPVPATSSAPSAPPPPSSSSRRPRDPCRRASRARPSARPSPGSGAPRPARPPSATCSAGSRAASRSPPTRARTSPATPPAPPPSRRGAAGSSRSTGSAATASRTATPASAGLLAGLTLTATPAAIYRALTEALAYGTRAILDTAAEGGVPVDRVILTSGLASASPFLVQTIADVTGRAVEVPAIANATCVGAAIHGAVAAGVVPDFATGAARFGARASRSFRPDPAAAAAYPAFYAEYRRLAADPELAQALRTLRRLGGGQPAWAASGQQLRRHVVGDERVDEPAPGGGADDADLVRPRSREDLLGDRLQHVEARPRPSARRADAERRSRPRRESGRARRPRRRSPPDPRAERLGQPVRDQVGARRDVARDQDRRVERPALAEMLAEHRQEEPPGPRLRAGRSARRAANTSTRAARRIPTRCRRS